MSRAGDLLSRLRATPGCERVRVVVLSGRIAREERWRFSVLGVRYGYYSDNGEDAIELILALDPATGRILWSKAFEGPIRAALTRQIDTLTALLPRAGEAAGVSRLPDGAAYYAATLAQHTTTDLSAAAIHRIDKEHGRTPYLIVGDPAMKQRSGITGDTILDEYSRHGIEIQVDGIPHDKQVGINKMLQYMKLNPKTGMPFLMVTDNCVNTIREIKSAKQNRIINKQVASRKNAPEGQREKDDHTTDALRYLVTLMPDLTPEDFAGQQKEKFDFVADMLGAVRPWNGIAERRRAAFDASGWKSPHSETAGLE